MGKSESTSLRMVELSGSPRQMGRQFGEATRELTQRFAEVRLERCVKKARELGLQVDAGLVLEVSGRCIDHHRRYDEGIWEEMEGIAEGAGLSPEMLMICNGLTDIRDAVYVAAGIGWGKSGGADNGGCTSWMAAPEATAIDCTLVGQTWDMHADAADYIVAVKRKPASGPASLAMTTAGCLSLVGLNSRGIAVGNNNLRPVDARPGVNYLAMIHKALSQSHLAGAINAVTQAWRCGGHNYYMADGEGSIVDVEATAAEYEVIQPAGAVYAHTNHYLTPRLQALAVPGEVITSSTWRLTRMLHVLAEQAGQITPESMMRAMSDDSGQGACRICRNDPTDLAPTCAAAVLCPQQRRMWIAAGEPKVEKFVELSL